MTTASPGVPGGDATEMGWSILIAARERDWGDERVYGQGWKRPIMGRICGA